MLITNTQPTNTDLLDFSDVNETGLLMLYGRALESRSPDAILKDEHAERMMDRIDGLIAGAQDRFLSMLYHKNIDHNLVVHAALRARQYDLYARKFLSRQLGSVIVNLGFGMDTRFQRIDDGEVICFDLDLPKVIRAKRQFLDENERYRMIAASVFDARWMDQVAIAARGPALFLAEGLFMYLEPERVRALVLQLQERFPGSELVCEVTNRRWTSGARGKIAARKMQRQLKLGEGTQYKFGLESPDEMESWRDGIELLEQWSYFDSKHPKLGLLRYFGKIELFRGVQYTVRYRLNRVR